MKKMRYAVVFAALCTLAACGGSGGSGGGSSAGDTTTPTPPVSGKDINDYRAENGLGPLTIARGASRAARRHAMDMAVNDFFDHTGSDGSSAADRLRDEGCTGTLAENIAWGARFDRESVQAAWMDSPGHRRNMLNPNVRVYGLEQVEDQWVMTLASRC